MGLLLSVLCFIVGSLASESYVSSASVIAAIVGFLLLLILGNKCWILIFLLPPIWELLPLPGAIRRLPGEFVVCSAVFLYWILLSCMGYAKVKWRSLFSLDVLVLTLALYVAATYIRRPVGMAFIGGGDDLIGGADYFVFVFAFLYYVALSCIPIKESALVRALRWSVVVVVLSTCIRTGMNVIGRGGLNVDAEQVGAFYWLGYQGVLILYSKFSLLSIVSSPIIMAASMVMSGCVFLEGGRAAFMMVFSTIVCVAVVKRELALFVLFGGIGVALLYAMTGVVGVNKMPYGVQRILWMLPGIEVSGRAEETASGTWEWRLDLWSLAFDKRTGYINNYIFGDGYGQSLNETIREGRAVMRGEKSVNQYNGFAVNGVWHNGVIHTIHRFGYVGLAIFALIMLYGSLLMFQVCMALRGKPLFVPVVFYTACYPANIPEFCLGAHGQTNFISNFAALALVKWVYCALRDSGRIIPFLQRKRYIPQMIRMREAQLMTRTNQGASM